MGSLTPNHIIIHIKKRKKKILLDSALPPCFPVNNYGVSWLISILHSNWTFRFTSSIIQFSFNSPRPYPTEHRGILTTPTQRFQEDFSIHLQLYSIFEHFVPFSNPSEHRGILTTPTQQIRSIFRYVSPLSLRRGSISNLRSSIGVVTGIMFRKALWNSPPNPKTVEQGTFFYSFQYLPCNTHGFLKDKKKKTKQLTLSPQSSSHDQPGGTSNRTPPGAQASSSQPIVNRFLGTISINSS